MNSTQRNIHMDDSNHAYVYFGKGFHGHVPTHSHEFYHCVLVLTGAITQQQNNKTHHLLPGDCFSTPPHTEHGLFIFDFDTTYYCLSISHSMMKSIFNSKTNDLYHDLIASPVCQVNPEVQNIFNPMFHLLLSLNNAKNKRDMLSQFTLIESFLKIMLKCTSVEEPDRSSKTPNQYEMQVQKCLKYIEENFASIKNIDELVDYSNLSKSMFYRLFRKETNQTVHRYLTEKRIHTAAKLIQMTNLSLKQIAQRVGYSEFSTFYRNFIKITNHSPSDYQAIIYELKKE